MARQIFVHLLPTLFEPEHVRGVAVIVDILRASTTISHALANGAAGIIPCLTVDDALSVRQEYGSDNCLIGGERGGVKIDGFDLSNSPDDYSTDVVSGKTIGFTTTNGTKALLRCDNADSILIGAFVNFSAVLHQAVSQQQPLHIVCAGTNGAVTGEDVLFAGALAHAVRNAKPDSEFNDQASVAEGYWLTECGGLDDRKIESAMRRAQGGRNLMRLGYEKDIATAAACDSVSHVGVVDSNGLICCRSAR